MKKLILIFALFLPALAFAQTGVTTITASKINNAGTQPLTGQWCATPAVPFVAYGGGNVPTVQVCYPVTNGALPAGAVLYDTSLTNPANVCYIVSVQNTYGQSIASYPCMQPSGSTYSFDTFVQASPPYIPTSFTIPQFLTNGVVNGIQNSVNFAGSGVSYSNGTITFVGGSGSMTWPATAGVANYAGSNAWGTSYQVGTAANDLVQLNSSGYLPALNASLLTAYPYASLTGTPTIPTSADWPNAGACTTNEWVTALNNGAISTCLQPAFSNMTGQASLTQLPTLTANTVLGALTATTPSALALPSCSGSTNALIWTSGTGFGCNTISTSGSGTVTSVAMTVPSDETVAGSPITTSGTLAVTRNSETANYFLASPNGAAGVPAYRAIIAADVPTLNQSTTGNAATATSAVTSTNLAGGALGSVPYQSAAATTAFLSGPATNGTYVLTEVPTASAAVAPTFSNAPALSAANMTSFPTLNQNTTGTAANVTGIVLPANGGTGGDGTGYAYGNGTSNFSYSTTIPFANLSGTATATQIPASLSSTTSVNGTSIPASATLMTTTTAVTASQLPAPTATTLGGIESAAAVANEWISSISTAGVPALSQPAFSNLSGTATQAQLPATSAVVSSVQQAGYTYAADTGTANAYAVALSPAPTIVAGSIVRFKALNANTGASTLTVNGATAVALDTQAVAALPSGAILAGGLYEAQYDGTEYQLLTSSANGGSTAGAIIQNPTTTAINTIAPTATTVVPLTINAPSGSTLDALDVKTNGTLDFHVDQYGIFQLDSGNFSSGSGISMSSGGIFNIKAALGSTTFDVDLMSGWAGSVAIGDVATIGTATHSVVACALNCTNAIGVVQSTPNSNDAIQTTGTVTVNFDGTYSPSAGWYVCTSSTTAGEATPQAAVCPSFRRIGYITASATSVTSGTVYLSMDASNSADINATTSVTTPVVNNTAAQTTVTCATSGTAVFSMPERGASYKKVIVYENACIGAASYTFPTAFTYAPQVLSQAEAATATTVSATAVTVTGVASPGSTGFLELDGY